MKPLTAWALEREGELLKNSEGEIVNYDEKYKVLNLDGYKPVKVEIRRVGK